jgi:polynucleotide 5'-hydroxyl-kinase GRC3/NOL9
MRALASTAYMHARLGAHLTWDCSTPLLAVQPWTVSLGPGHPLSRAYLLGESAGAIAPADLPLALNGSLVALLAGPASDEIYVPASTPGDDATVLGLALIRAVRQGATEGTLQLQLITPLPAAVLTKATAIARNGALELPPATFLDFCDRPGRSVPEDGLAGTRWDDVPFFDAGESRAVGGERRRFRRNIQRKGV